tara:strand:+ start:815 stop:1006 length:192 start_codon:yes stop_codon:yes gene_type:complete
MAFKMKRSPFKKRSPLKKHSPFKIFAFFPSGGDPKDSSQYAGIHDIASKSGDSIVEFLKNMNR